MSAKTAYGKESDVSGDLSLFGQDNRAEQREICHCGCCVLVFTSAVMAAILFVVIRMGICGLLCKWKKRWEYYGYKNMELFKKSVMTGIAFMVFSLSLAVMKIPFIPIRLNVVSW